MKISFFLGKNIFNEFLSNKPMWSCRTFSRPLIQSAVYGIKLRTEFTTHVEPPVTNENSLTKLSAIRTQEGRLSAIDVTVVPGLAASLYVSEEARVRLIVAVELGIGHFAKYRVVRTWSTWKKKKNIYISLNKFNNIISCIFN